MKLKTGWWLPVMLLISSVAGSGQARSGDLEKRSVYSGTDVKRTAENTVAVDAEHQAVMEAWADEEQALLDRIEAARKQLEETHWLQKQTAAYVSTMETKIKALKERAAEMETMERELLPLLDQTLHRLEGFLDRDLPAGIPRRSQALVQAKAVLKDFDMGLIAKNRTALEALSREVDRGHTVSIVEDDIEVDGQIKRVKLIQAGRIGLYALSMDGRNAYIWQSQKEGYIPARDSLRDIEEAIAMAEGRRIIGLSCLPVTGNGVQPGGEHDRTD